MTATAEMSPRDRGRKAFTLFLQRMAGVRAGDVAKQMGISDSALSAIKTQKAEEVLSLCAHLGLKLVPTDMVCVRPTTFKFLTDTHQAMLQRAPQLLWETDEFQDSGFSGGDV